MMTDIVEQALVDLSAAKGGANWKGMNRRQIEAYLRELGRFTESEALAAIKRAGRQKGPFPDLNELVDMIPSGGGDGAVDMSRCCCWTVTGTLIGNPEALRPDKALAEYLERHPLEDGTGPLALELRAGQEEIRRRVAVS